MGKFSCPTGSELYGNQCYGPCRVGFTISINDHALCVSTISCPASYTLEAETLDECVKIPSSVLTSFTYESTTNEFDEEVITSTTVYSCPTGYTLDELYDPPHCTYSCLSMFTENGESCLKATHDRAVYDPYCGDGYIYVNGECVVSVNTWVTVVSIILILFVIFLVIFMIWGIMAVAKRRVIVNYTAY